MSFCSEYDFEIDRIVEELRFLGVEKVLLQFTEGFQPCAPYVVRELRSRLGIEIVVSANPSYGPCIVDEATARDLGIELVIHFGHLEHPRYRPSITTIFVPVQYRGEAKLGNVEELASLRNLCVATTAQHIDLAKDLAEKLSARFLGIVYGCYVPPYQGCEKLLIVAGGSFHCLSAKLLAPHLEVLCLDPYVGRLWRPDREYEKLIRARLWKVSQALDARRWLIVSGLYGQRRKEIVNDLRNLIEDRGGEVIVVHALRIDESILRNLEAHRFDAIVVAACPRIAIDDLQHFEKPVLTPGEARMVLERRLEGYVYPW